MDTDEYVACPYNSQHRIVRFRMPAHMLKCRRNYKGPPLEQCSYNATHLVPAGELAKHEATCHDCYLFNNAQFCKIAEQYKPN